MLTFDSGATARKSRFLEMIDDEPETAPATDVTSHHVSEAPEDPSKGIAQNGSKQESQTAPAEKDNHFTSHPVMKKFLNIPNMVQNTLKHPRVKKIMDHRIVKNIINSAGCGRWCGHGSANR